MRAAAKTAQRNHVDHPTQTVGIHTHTGRPREQLFWLRDTQLAYLIGIKRGFSGG